MFGLIIIFSYNIKHKINQKKKPNKTGGNAGKRKRVRATTCISETFQTTNITVNQVSSEAVVKVFFFYLFSYFSRFLLAS